MKKVLVGTMIVLALGSNDHVLADSNTQVETEKGKSKISSVLEEKSKYLHQKEITEFEKLFQEDMLIEYRENPKYFWEYFGYVSDPELDKKDLIEDVLKRSLDDYELYNLGKKIDEKFGEYGYKSYFDYLFFLSLEETWNMETPLFQMGNNDDYFILTEDLIEYFIGVGFEFVGNIDSYDRFTFRKTDDGGLEIVSISSGELEIIGSISSEKIEKGKNKAYSIMNFILELKSEIK